MYEILDHELTQRRAEELRRLNSPQKEAVWGVARLAIAQDKSLLATPRTTMEFMDLVEDTIDEIDELHYLHVAEPRSLRVAFVHRPRDYGLRLQMNPDGLLDPDASIPDQGLVTAYDYKRSQAFSLTRKPAGRWEHSRTMSVDAKTGRPLITGIAATLLVAGRRREWEDTIQATEQEVREAMDAINGARKYHYDWLAGKALAKLTSEAGEDSF
jgi:hypothetical protein